jgi:hypothetical protein
MRQLSHVQSTLRWTLLAIGLLLPSACSDNPAGVSLTNPVNNGSVTVKLGDALNLTLGSVGPTSYVSTPNITGSAIVFLGSGVLSPSSPGGARLQYRFRAQGRGTSQIEVPRIQVPGMPDEPSFVLEVVVR